MSILAELEVSERPTPTTSTTPSPRCDKIEESVPRNSTVLPLALREAELTEEDFNRLFGIAEDRAAQVGRLRRPTGSIPSVRSVED